MQGERTQHGISFITFDKTKAMAITREEKDLNTKICNIVVGSCLSQRAKVSVYNLTPIPTLMNRCENAGC